MHVGAISAHRPNGFGDSHNRAKVEWFFADFRNFAQSGGRENLYCVVVSLHGSECAEGHVFHLAPESVATAKTTGSSSFRFIVDRGQNGDGVQASEPIGGSSIALEL